MRAHFLLGPAGSGKTFRCLAEIRAALHENPSGLPLILLAPKQATFQLERQLLADVSLQGYTRLQIFSFERLAQFIFDVLGVLPPKFLSAEGRIMVLRALLIRHADELKLFRGSARRPGFAQELGRLLNELQQHQITSVKLRLFSEQAGLRRELHDKLCDLAFLLEKYIAWLHTHGLLDSSHLLEVAAEALHSKSLIRPLPFALKNLWLDGFAEMTPQELDLLAAVFPHCEQATLAFCLDKSAAGQMESQTSWLSIWSAVGKTFQQCRQRLEALPNCEIDIEVLERKSGKNRFAAQPALQRLEACWQNKEGLSQANLAEKNSALQCIHITACPNLAAETMLAAREILKFVRHGARFRDCAVLVRNLDGYHKSLERTFHRYDIPFFLDRREAVAHHPLAELTRSALRTIIYDWPQEDWFAALKTGFVNATENEIDRLENESLARGWRGKKWLEPIKISEDSELENSLEWLRQKITPPFERFAKKLARLKNSPNGEQLAETLRGLWSDLNVETRLNDWSDDPIHDSSAAMHTTVWEQMNAWLDNLALAFAGEPLPLREWLPVLEAGLANLTVGLIPPALDQVLIGAIDRSRNPDLKLALVLGMNETVFPAAPVAPPILTDADRDELTIPLGPDLRERLARECYFGYIACTRASEKLVLTYAHQDASDKPLNPSPFIAHVKQIFPETTTEAFETETKLAEVEHVNEAAPLLMGIQDSESKNKGLKKLMALPALEAVMHNLEALREPLPSEKITPVLAEKLFGPILRTSVSRLEEFAGCPFRFFIRSGLRADERKIFELDARERGSFQHDVLKIFHEELTRENKRWRDLTPATARGRVAVIATELMQSQDYRDGLLLHSAQTQFEARALTSALQDFVEVIVSWMHTQYEFDPQAVELGFGGTEDRLPPWEISLNDGHKLALQGRIDRVDLWHDSAGNALAVVLDYKSSGKKLDQLLIEHGVQLQLLAYLAALCQWPNPQEIFQAARLIPAGVFYVNLRGEYQGGGTRDEILTDAGAARRTAYRHTGRFDVGALPHLDRIGAADQFNYHRNLDGSLHKRSAEAISPAKFEKLLDGVEAQLQRLGEMIFSGAAQVDPYRKGKQTPCTYCDYQPACRIDKWTHQYRMLRAAVKEAVSDIPELS